MKKDSNLIIRINSDIKKEATRVAEENGISISSLINVFLTQIAKSGKIPMVSLAKAKSEDTIIQNKANAITLIQMIRNYITKSEVFEKVDKLYLFGSYARGEERPDSDVDLYVEFDDEASLLDHATLHLELEEFLRKKVDLITSEKNNPFFAKN